jgi:putative transposase
LVLACRVALGADGLSAIQALTEAIQGHGLPGIVLSDNGSCFTGKSSDSSVAFERHLWAHAVRTINSRIAHPQTCGKIERWHQTLKKWLRRQPAAATLEQLQDQLNQFALIYNTTRPHTALHGDTPAEAYARTPKHRHDPDLPSTAPTRAAQRRTTVNGQFAVNKCLLHLGAKYRNQTITVFVTGNHVAVYHEGTFLGDVDLNEGQAYATLNFATKVNKNVSAMS